MAEPHPSHVSASAIIFGSRFVRWGEMLGVVVKDLGHDFWEYLCDEACSDNQYSERDNVIHWIPLIEVLPPLGHAAAEPQRGIVGGRD